MTARVWIGFLAVVGLTAALRFSPGAQTSRTKEAPPSPSSFRVPAKQLQAVGTSSCSARACHGALAPVGDDSVRRDEYTRWLTTDRHAQAYLLLLEERSQGIAKKLGFSSAHTSEQCLACHQFPAPSAVTRAGRWKEEKFFGIGCESCHGGAEHWLEAHTQKLTAKEKEDKGMTDVAEPSRLAQACVGCHVGSPPTPDLPAGRDVNHDLIVAGHPRLNFEFAAFRANLPPHWNEAKKSRSPGFEARAWAVGQAITAKAALELLAWRTGQPSWPEFAEYDCFACHHDLQAASWRQKRSNAGGTPGSLSWGNWYYSVPRLLAGPAFADVPSLLASLDRLEASMRRPFPDREDVAKEAGNAVSLLEKLLEKTGLGQYDAKSVARDFLKGLNDKKLGASRENWDAAGQLYLALAALNVVKPDPQVDTVIRQLLVKLAFPAATEPGKRYDSPKEFQPEPLREILRSLGP